MNAEAKTRAALEWAIPETVLRMPSSLRNAAEWRWSPENADLSARIGDDIFRFHVAAERRGARKLRIAVLSVTDGQGKATWEAEMPAEITAE